MNVNAAAPYRPAGPLNIATALQPYDGPWNARLAAHLLRRAGFGGTPEDIARNAAMPAASAVDALIHYSKDNSLPGAPDKLDDGYAQQRNLFRAAGRAAGGIDDASLTMQKMEVQKLRQATNISMLRWWTERMIKTQAPLQEKMTLFWHGHFASSALQKGITPKEAVDQNWLFRNNALGNVREMTHLVSKDPAMLKYLDNARSNKEHPNENYARELMELFTLGIGNYTESDIRESARAFTGYTILGPLRGGGFYFNAKDHDYGMKTFLNARGELTGDDVVEIIFKQPAAPRWFAKKLLNFFVYNDPEPELIEAFAQVLLKNDFQISPSMSTLLRSNVFFSDRAYRSLVKSPVEFVVGTHQLFDIAEVTPESLGALNRMGQVPFHPPSVKGWDGGATWLNSQTVLARENFVNYLVTSQMMTKSSNWLMAGPPPSSKDATEKLIGTILHGDASPASAAKLQAYLDGGDASANAMLSGENYEERMRGAAYLTMAMPAYQLN
jgi:uncharacterized protein (DUF1800 family)